MSRKVSKFKDWDHDIDEEPEQPPDVCPVFTYPLRHRVIKEDSELELYCCAEGSPVSQIKWSKDGCELQGSDPRYQIKFMYGGICILKVKECKDIDGGHYVCEAENNMGRTETRCKVHVDVVGRIHKEANTPVFFEFLTDKEADPDTHVKFSCAVSGTPKPKIPKADIRWYKDGEVIEGGIYHIKYKDEICSLSIKAVTVGDAGEYWCVASNSAGLACTTAHLAVTGC